MTPDDVVKTRKGVRWLAEEVERLRGELDAFTTKGTALGDRLRGEGLSNCYGCANVHYGQCRAMLSGDSSAMDWRLSASFDTDGILDKTATGCPSWKPKTDQKGTP